MRFIHCSDFHLDSKMAGLSVEKAKQRREELFIVFEEIVNFAIQNDVRAIIIAGDLFDAEIVCDKSIKRIMHVIESNKNIDFLYLPGNHEKKAIEGRVNGIPENLKLFGNNWTEYLYGNVCIGGITTNYESQLYNKYFSPETTNIVVLHGQLIGHSGEAQEGEISLPKLKDKNIDYLALGHVHRFISGAIDNRGVYVYSGCPEGRGFDETGEKGIVILDVNENKILYEFLPINGREICEVVVDTSGFGDWFSLKDYVIKNVNETVKEGSIIRVKFVGESNGFGIDALSIKLALKNKYFSVVVVDETKFCLDNSFSDVDNIAIREFVRLVEESDIENLTKNAVIMSGIKALKGEEL